MRRYIRLQFGSDKGRWRLALTHFPNWDTGVVQTGKPPIVRVFDNSKLVESFAHRRFLVRFPLVYTFWPIFH